MNVHHNLRVRPAISWKELCYGEKIHFKKEKPAAKREVLPETYEIERLIVRKTDKNQGKLYLVKWLGYPDNQCTWEPERHIDLPTLNSFLIPAISQDRLANAARQLEDAIQQRLRSRNNTVIIRFDLDIYRYCFETDLPRVLHDIDDFRKLPLSTNWYYRINDKGRGLTLSFPLAITPKMHMRKVYIKDNASVVLMTVPYETLRVTCATKVCQLETL